MYRLIPHRMRRYYVGYFVIIESFSEFIRRLTRMNAAIVFDQRLLIDMLSFCVRSLQREGEPVQQLAL